MTRAVHGFGLGLRRRSTSQAMPLKWQLAFAVFVVLLIFTAFSVVYVKDYSRRLFMKEQQLVQLQNQREVEWNKLLLEAGAWSAQSRIQQVAKTKLGMVTPPMKQIVIIHDS